MLLVLLKEVRKAQEKQPETRKPTAENSVLPTLNPRMRRLRVCNINSSPTTLPPARPFSRRGDHNQ